MHDDLARKVLGALNSEYKCLVSGFCLAQGYQSSWSVMQAAGRLTLGESSRDHKFYAGIMSRGSLAGFISQDASGGYCLNSRAYLAGLPEIARFMMYSTYKFHMPLRSWLGQEQHDSPYNSARVLEELHRGGRLRKTDLESLVGMCGGSMHQKLNKLAESCLIEYNAIPARTGRLVVYVPNGMEAGINNFKHSAFADRVLGIYRQHLMNRPFTSADFLHHGLKGKGKIEQTLRAMERKGLIRNTTQWVGGVRYSDAALSERGRRLCSDTVFPVLSWLRERDSRAFEYIRHKEIYAHNIPLAFGIYCSSQQNSHVKRKARQN